MGSKKQWAIFLTATVLTVCLLAVTVLVCAGQAGKAMRQHSFDELAASGRRLAEDYYSTIKNDQMFLSAIAELIARQKLSDVDTLLRVMNSPVCTNTPHDRTPLLLALGTRDLPHDAQPFVLEHYALLVLALPRRLLLLRHLHPAQPLERVEALQHHRLQRQSFLRLCLRC